MSHMDSDGRLYGELLSLTRRQYLVMKAVEHPALPRGVVVGHAGLLMAMEAVSSVAIEHPEWDMDELHTWPEWEAIGG
jgi:hypothetical protein